MCKSTFLYWQLVLDFTPYTENILCTTLVGVILSKWRLLFASPLIYWNCLHKMDQCINYLISLIPLRHYSYPPSSLLMFQFCIPNILWIHINLVYEPERHCNVSGSKPNIIKWALIWIYQPQPLLQVPPHPVPLLYSETWFTDK